MADTITIGGSSYVKRNPLGVLGLSLITLGIYGIYWYYKVNQEIQRFTGDDTISPSRSLLALVPGFLLIVPPFIAYYNTANHIAQMERQRGVASEISPALVIGLMLVGMLGLVVGPYMQEHLNRVWDLASMPAMTGSAATAPPPPPAPVG
jgi:hypothetical protein